MTGYCKGACTSNDFPYNTRERSSYEDGYRRCDTCQIFIQTDTRLCPCCRVNLRASARGTQYRKKKRDMVKRY